jgi:ABC-type multidrug transport system fused ATPase/permease subunit
MMMGSTSIRTEILPRIGEFFVDDDPVIDEEEPAAVVSQQQSHYEETAGRGTTKAVSYARQEAGQNIEWRDVCMNVQKTKKKGDVAAMEKKILDHVWGSAQAGELTAIMGPSGTFL